MDETAKMKDREIARLLRGRIPAGEEAPELARFLRDFDTTYPQPSIDHCEAAHLSAIFAAALQLAETESSPVRQAGGTPKSALRAQGPEEDKRNWTAHRFPKWAGVKLAIPLAIMLLAFGGVAFAGGLVYHGGSDTGRSTDVTQPGPVDTAPDGTGGDSSRGPAIVKGSQSDVNNADEAAIDKNDQNDQGDAKHAAISENDQNDQNDAHNAGINENDQSDQSDAHSAAINENDQSDATHAAIGPDDQSDATHTAIGQNVQSDQRANEHVMHVDQGDRGSPVTTERTETSR